MLRHPLAQTELDPAYVLTRWPQLPDHIRQTIMTLVRSVDSTTAPPAATIKKRSSARTEKWDKTSFFNSLASYQTSEEVRVAETLTEWLENNFSRVDWRIGKRGGQLLAVIQHNGVECSDIRVEANGYVRIRFRRLKAKEAFCNEAKRLELLRRLNVVDGVELPVDSINGGPKFPLSALNTEQSFSQFLDTLKWFQQEITSTS